LPDLLIRGESSIAIHRAGMVTLQTGCHGLTVRQELPKLSAAGLAMTMSPKIICKASGGARRMVHMGGCELTDC
jgi:hypothetical protein